MKKVFLQTQFGSPHAWTEQYFENFRRLAPYGWHLKVFTPNPLPESDNIEIVRMTLDDFDQLIEAHTGVKVGNFINDKGVPNRLVSDFYPAYGQILQDYIQGFDFWGFTNWDMVYGRLDHFISDETLAACDIWADEVNGINGIFTLMRNNGYVNNLFRFVPNWAELFALHEPCAFDEIRMTDAVRKLAASGAVRFKHPEYFPNHSYDRLVQHLPEPNLYFTEDGALIERLEDCGVCAPSTKDHYGREIMSFHFSRTKRWPASLERSR